MSDQNNSEFVTLPNQNSIETCLVNLRACDTVIFVLSKRYGGSLGKAGFTDVSATHLEYLEAKKHGKRILFFVRDRLLADFNHFQKTQKTDGLLWVETKDARLFEIIDDRKKLQNAPQDNWIMPFTSSLDVKQRLAIDLKLEMRENRLDKLIASGNIPFLSIWGTAEVIPNSLDIKLTLEVKNVGTQVAISPVLVLIRANNYQEVLDQKLYIDPASHTAKGFTSLEPSATYNIPATPITVATANEEIRLIASVFHKTIQGDLLTDVTQIIIRTATRPKIDIRFLYTTKHYLADDTFEKIVEK